jgi:dissimilatory sulfite reductase related protein
VTEMTLPAGHAERAAESGARFRLVAGRDILFDNEDFLWRAEDWSEDVALQLAVEAGMPGLTDAQWRVIGFLRQFYLENGRSPLNRRLSAGVGMSLLELEQLFPRGIKYGARRLAGLPNPKICL